MSDPPDEPLEPIESIAPPDPPEPIDLSAPPPAPAAPAPAGHDSASWFGYIGLGIPIVAMLLGLAAMVFAILYFLRHGFD